MKRSSRPNPISKKRRARSGKPGKLGVIRLYGTDLKMLRTAAIVRSRGKCEMERDGQPCNEPITWANSEMAHIVSRGAGGSDVLDNVLMSCKLRRDGKPGCHTLSHNSGGKPCPPKQRDECDRWLYRPPQSER